LPCTLTLRFCRAEAREGRAKRVCCKRWLGGTCHLYKCDEW
jgi:hypothetical protein